MEVIKQCPDAVAILYTHQCQPTLAQGPARKMEHPRDRVRPLATAPPPCFMNIHCHSLLRSWWRAEEVQNLPKWTQKFCGLLLLKSHFSTGSREENGTWVSSFGTVHTVFPKHILDFIT